MFDYGRLTSFSFAPNKGKNTYTLFGILNQEIVKIKYTLDTEAGDEGEISEEVTLMQKEYLNGTMMRIQATEKFVIISDSNGAEPGVHFFDHDLEPVEFFPMPSLEEAPYNFEVHIVADLKML